MRVQTTMKWFIIVLIFAFAMGSPCVAEIKDVCFQHKARDTIKTNCKKIKGKHDAFPVFKCFDDDAELKSFDPGKEWEEIDGNDPICQPDPSKGDIDPPKGDGEKEE